MAKPVFPKKQPPKPSNREPDREPRAQFAALPWRRNADGEVEVLMITSRDTRRWVIPKGWPIKGIKSPKSAAQEAFEEAGVIGKVRKSPVGAYAYDHAWPPAARRVAVFALAVERGRGLSRTRPAREALAAARGPPPLWTSPN